MMITMQRTILLIFGCSKVNSTWLIIAELTNRTRKSTNRALFWFMPIFKTGMPHLFFYLRMLFLRSQIKWLIAVDQQNNYLGSSRHSTAQSPPLTPNDHNQRRRMLVRDWYKISASFWCLYHKWLNMVPSYSIPCNHHSLKKRIGWQQVSPFWVVFLHVVWKARLTDSVEAIVKRKI